MLNVVNFGGGAYVIYAEVLPIGRDRGRPRAVLGHVRPPGAAAADRGERARRGDRPDRRRTSRPARCDSAREKIVAALGARPGRGGPARRHRRRDGRRDHARRSSARSHAGRLMEIEYWAPNEDAFTERVIEPYALFN